MRLTALTCLLMVASLRSAEPAAIRTEELTSPTTSANASGPAVTVSPEGTVWLTWLERDARSTALKVSVFDAAEKKWAAARTITSGPDLYVGHSDFPALTVGRNGNATALWFINNPPA